MTQGDFDRRFDIVVKTGLAILLGGIAELIGVGLPAAALFDNFGPFFGGCAIGIAGGVICVGAFAYDDLFQPALEEIAKELR